MIADGIHYIPADVYHASDALSSSGARKLLPPSCPALFHYERSNPIQATPDMEFGSVTHHLLLGKGDAYQVLDYPNYRTKESQQARDETRAAGKIPILRHDYQVAWSMVNVVLADDWGRRLFDGGESEQSLFWTDDATGVRRRARLDKLKRIKGRPVIADYKTAANVSLDAVGKSSWDYGYAQSADWYMDAVRALVDANPAFVIVSQMKEPPYLVTIGQFDATSLMIGRDLNRRAINLYAECTESGVWPGFGNGIDTVISLPGWIQKRWMEDLL